MDCCTEKLVILVVPAVAAADFGEGGDELQALGDARPSLDAEVLCDLFVMRQRAQLLEREVTDASAAKTYHSYDQQAVRIAA